MGSAAKGVGCVVVFVAVAMGALLAVGVPFGQMSAGEIGLFVGLLATSALFGWIASRDYTQLDPHARAIAASLGLGWKKLTITGKLGGLEVTVDEVLLERVDKSHAPGWSTTVSSDVARPLAILSARDVITEQASRLTPVDASSIVGERYTVGVGSKSAASPYRGAIEGAEWITPELVSQLDALGVVQIRVDGRDVRVVVRRPPPDPLIVRRSIVFARTLAAPPFDPSTLPPEPSSVPADRRRRTFSLVRIAAIVGFGLPLVVLVGIAPDCSGYGPEMVRLANACALSRDALGSPIEPRLIGWHTSTSSNRNEISELLLKGPRDDGVVTVHAYRLQRSTPVSERPITRAVLETDTRAIELVTCTEGARIPIAAAHQLNGTVSAVTGGAPVAVGSACTFTITPMLGRVLPCRTVARCGATQLIGITPGQGFMVCAEAPRGDGEADIVVSDEDRRSPRSEPTLMLDERSHVARLESPGRDWTMTVSLGGSAPRAPGAPQ